MRRVMMFGPRQQTLPRAELFLANFGTLDDLPEVRPAKNRLEIAGRFRYVAEWSLAI